MILTLYLVFVAISLVLITIGLMRPTESAQALIGFFLLFVCSMVIVTGNLQYEVENKINSTYTYDSNNRVNFTMQTIAPVYRDFEDATGENTAHWIGYYLALASSIGFLGTIWSLKKNAKPD